MDNAERQEMPVNATDAGAKSTVLMSGKAKIAIVGLLFLIGISYLAWIAFSEATVKYLSVNEAIEIDTFDNAQSIGVVGKLVPGSYIKSPDGVTANFRLKDENGSSQLPVVYAGEVGQVFFNDHSEIILNGTMSSDGVLEAHLLTVRCPSKYLTEQEQMEIEGEIEPPPYQPDYLDSKPEA